MKIYVLWWEEDSDMPTIIIQRAFSERSVAEVALRLASEKMLVPGFDGMGRSIDIETTGTWKIAEINLDE